MLRSTIHASSSYLNYLPFSLRKPVSAITCPSPSRYNLMKRCCYEKPIRNCGSMAVVLEIFSPLDLFLSPNAVIYVALMRKCIRSRNFLMGRLAHVHLIKLGYNTELLVSNVLLDLYCKAGLLDDSMKLFGEMSQRDQISWCTLIVGHTSHGFDMEAFSLFRRMLEGGLKPNHFIISSVLKACSSSGILELGVLVHCRATKCGLIFDRFVEAGLVGMYAKCGALDEALKVFYEIPVKNSIAWNAIISGCIQNEYFSEAAEMCREMCRIGFVMDTVTLRIVMCAGSALEAFDFCKSIHVYSLKIGLDTDCFVVAELVRLLAVLGEVAYMSELFNKVIRPDVSLYALLISGYHDHGYRVVAVNLVKELHSFGMKPKEGAWISIIKLCLSKEEGTQIQACTIKAGHLSQVSVGNALISMYIRCAGMIEAYESFLKMPEHDAVSWTAIITGLTHNLHFVEALETFQAFRKTDLQLDDHSVAAVINACTGLQAIIEGKQLHALALKLCLEFSNFVSASILNMYAKCGYIGSAIKLFSYASSTSSLILTNVMLAGYCWNYLPLEAFKLFKGEFQSGFTPDGFSLSTMLGACADMRSVQLGKQLHCHVVKCGLEFSDNVIWNAIINMYAKSGNIACACQFYYGMKRKDIILYEMLMLGYLQHIQISDVLRLFYQMQGSFLHGNPVAFARILRGWTDFTNVNLAKQIHASILKLGLVSDSSRNNLPICVFDKDNVLGVSNEASHESSGGENASCNSDYQEDGKETRHSVYLSCMKHDRARQSCYEYADDIGFSLDAVSRMSEASPISRLVDNGLMRIKFLMNSEIDKSQKAYMSMLGRIL